MADLAVHYSRFRVAERLLLTGHSHQAWPDGGFEGVGAGALAAGMDPAPRETPELALVDLRLPDHSGLEVVRAAGRYASGGAFIGLGLYTAFSEARGAR